MSEAKNDRRTFILRTFAAVGGVLAGPAVIGAVLNAAA
jgi:hypothetical protein